MFRVEDDSVQDGDGLYAKRYFDFSHIFPQLQHTSAKQKTTVTIALRLTGMIEAIE